MPKKKNIDSSRPGDPAYKGDEWYPSSLVGRALGLQDWKNDYPTAEQKGKGDLPKGVALSDIREQYGKKGKRK